MYKVTKQNKREKKMTFIRGDQTGNYLITLDQNGLLTLYSNSQTQLPVLKTFQSNAKDVQFLPPSLGLAFITGNSDGTMTVFHQEGLNWKEYQIDDFNEFSSCLTVSQFPPTARVGCLSKESIAIFDIVFDDKPHLLLIRKFPDPEQFTSFDFAQDDVIWAVSKNKVLKFKLSYNKPEVFRVKENPIKIVTSPVRNDTYAILFDNNSVSVFKDQIRKEIPHTVPNATTIAFSPLATSLMIYGDTQEEWKEAAPGSWII